MSDTTYVMLFLTLSGGLQDAYSYFVRGRVFANAQTGNFVLMAMDFSSGNFEHGASYLFPIFSFGMGILVAEQLKGRVSLSGKIHWRQLVVALEILILTLVGLLPVSPFFNPIANAFTSFSCAMQVQAFKKVNGHFYASTMCIGNIRSGMEAFSAYVRVKEKKLLRKSLQYLLVIFIFFIGAAIGSTLIRIANEKAGYVIFASCFLLAVGFSLMMIEDIKKERQ